tara:strand:- start:85 stop:189 length:105 start_codon:yes stop_codon:yes gene_type:complete
MIDWFWNLIDKCVEKSLQKQSDEMFKKHINQEEE